MGSMNVGWLTLALVAVGFVYLAYRSQQLKRQYESEVHIGLERTKKVKDALVSEEDIKHLPEPVQNYLRYVGVLGKQKVKSLKATIDGSMKIDRDKDWAPVKVEQYSFFDRLTRLFFIKMRMFGVSVLGLHCYKDAKAIMDIRVAGLVPVANGKGPTMDRAETVTVLNDMCILAPATLIDERVQWEFVDALTAEAFFTNEGVTVSARLYFNDAGQLVNFASDDRYYSPTGKTYESVRWSTPVSNYQRINGYILPTYGEAVWSFPEGDFCYARFNVRDVSYN